MRRALILLSALVLSGFWATNQAAAGTLDRVNYDGVLVVGVTDVMPPFGFRENDAGELLGYDIDFVTGIASRLGVQIRIKVVTPADRLAALLDGEIDIIAAGLTRSDAWNAVVAFSDHYLVSGQKLISRTGTIRRHGDLQGKRLGAVVGTFAESCARERCKVSTVVTFDGYVEGVEALREGKIDAFTADEAILVDLFAGLPRNEYEIPDLLILREEYQLAVRRGDDAFRNVVNQSIAAMREDGEAERIRSKWYGPLESLPPPAYGAVVRRASVRPRLLGISLSGLLHPGAGVVIRTPDGVEIGNGQISSVFGDEFYVDADAEVFDRIRPGFLVTMNMNNQMAMDVLMKRRDLLARVAAQAQQESKEVSKQIAREASAKQNRAVEMDTLREQTRATSYRDRSRYYRNYDYYRRGYRHYRSRSRGRYY